jgi:ATP-binding cassette subfamily B protein
LKRTKKLSDLTILRRLLIQAKPYWVHISGMFLLGLLVTPLSLLIPVPLKIAVDSVVGSAPIPRFFEIFVPQSFTSSKLSLLFAVVCVQVSVIFLIDLHAWANYVLQTYTGERLTLGFRENLLRQVQRLSFSFHDSRGTADSIYRIQYDAASIQYITIYGIIPVISHSLRLVFMIYVTARINLELALIALAVTPLLYVITRTYSVRMRHKYLDMKQMQSSLLNIVQEIMNTFRVIKAFGREENEQTRFTRHSGKTIRARTQISFAEGAYGLLVNLTIALGGATALFIGIRNVRAGILSLGELLMVLTYLSQLYGPLKDISDKFTLLQDSFASAQRAFELLDEIPEVIEQPNARPIRQAVGAIEFKNVSFSYGNENQVLRDVSFSIAPGTRAGIVGKTGAGKTTLLSLLTRFYDPSAGEIMLDQVDMRSYRLADLRRQFAIVFQETVLFSSSIAENIAYGRLNASQEDIVEAAKVANAHDFISKMPEGYDTLVGERGMQLSGGERQRIALARAFLRNAPILILDEPTSSVDEETEAGIIAAMERIMVGRTTFVISHRPSTLTNCDVLLVLKKGRLVATTMDPSSLLYDESIAGEHHFGSRTLYEQL